METRVAVIYYSATGNVHGLNGQSTVTIDGDRATGESYTIAPPLYERRRAEDHDRLAPIP
jgi:hypothetical protein